LERSTENGDLRVVTRRRVRRFAVFFGRFRRGKSFESIVVEMLVEGTEFAGASLEDFLSDESTENGVDRSEFTGRLVREFFESRNVKIALELCLRRDVFGELDESSGVGRVTRSGKARVFRAECGEGLETDVKGSGTVEFSEIGNEEFGLVD